MRPSPSTMAHPVSSQLDSMPKIMLLSLSLQKLRREKLQLLAPGFHNFGFKI